MALANHLGGHVPDSNSDTSRPVPFIGCRLSLISKVGVRYEGTLLGVDSEKGELTLGSARSYGTENRRAERPIAPQPYEYQSITFKGDSISELMVPESPVPPVGADPAVVQAQSAPGSRTILNPLSTIAGNWPVGGPLPVAIQQPFPPQPFQIGTPAQASQPRPPFSSSAPVMPGVPTSALSAMPPGRPPFPQGIAYAPYPALMAGVPPSGVQLGPIGSQPVGFQQPAQAQAPLPSIGPIAPPAPRPQAPLPPTQATPNIPRELAPPNAFASQPQLGPSPSAGFIGQARPAPQPAAPISPPQPPPVQPQPIRLVPEQQPAMNISPANKPMSGFQPPNLPPRLAAQANSAFSQSPQTHSQASSQQAPPPPGPITSQAPVASYQPPGFFASVNQQQAQPAYQRPAQAPQAPDAFADDENKQKEEAGGEEQYEEAGENEENVVDYTEPADKQSRGPAPSADQWNAASSQQQRSAPPARASRTVEYPPDDDDTVAVENFEGAAGANPQQKGSARPMKFDTFSTGSFNRAQGSSESQAQGYQRGFGNRGGRSRGGRFQRGGAGPLPAWSQDHQLEAPAIPGQLGAPRMMTVTLNTSFTNRPGADNASQTSASTRRTEPGTPRGFGGFYVGSRGGISSGGGGRGYPRGGSQQYQRPVEYEQYGNDYEEAGGGGGYYPQATTRGRAWFTSGPMSHRPPQQSYEDSAFGYGSTPQSSVGAGALRGRSRGYSASSSSTRGGSAGPPPQRSNRPELNWPSSNSRWGGWGWNGGGGGQQPSGFNSFSYGQRQSGFQQAGQSSFGQSGPSSYSRGRGGGRGGFESRGAGTQQGKRQSQQTFPRRGSDGELNPLKTGNKVGNDYDFESNNAEFAKLFGALSIDGMDKSGLMSPSEAHAEVEGDGKTLEEGELAENEVSPKENEGVAEGEGEGEESSTATGVGAVNLSVHLNVNVSADAGGLTAGASTPSQQLAPTSYNKTRSFFDNLKQSDKEIPSAGGHQLSDDRKLNVETFGPGAANVRRVGNYRARFTGRGPSRGGRGFQRMRWPR